MNKVFALLFIGFLALFGRGDVRAELFLTELSGFGSGGGDTLLEADAVAFAGSQIVSRGSDLTGNADGSQGTISLWFRLAGGDGSSQHFWITQNAGESGAATVQLSRTSGNKIQLALLNSSDSTVLSMTSTTSYTSSSGWKHLLISWNMSTPVAYMYVSDADDEAGGSTENTGTVDYTRSNQVLGANSGFNTRFNGDMAEVYINFSSFIDITQEENRRKFISATGKPIDLGSDGSTPTGSAPIVYLSVRPGDAASAFVTNRGTGGNFTDVNGGLTIAATSPSD